MRSVGWDREGAQGEPQVSLVIEEWNEKMWTGKVKIVKERGVGEM